MQEFLNRSPEYRWGIISNGLHLRLLRDNASLRRAAYVEFDLEAMMTGELYAEFSLLWLVCHQSRLEILGGSRGLGVEDGEYRTKRVILEMYDEMAAAMAGGPPYQTRLDPPPADPRVAHDPM
jgi:hypothetical protein